MFIIWIIIVSVLVIVIEIPLVINARAERMIKGVRITSNMAENTTTTTTTTATTTTTMIATEQWLRHVL